MNWLSNTSLLRHHPYKALLRDSHSLSLFQRDFRHKSAEQKAQFTTELGLGLFASVIIPEERAVEGIEGAEIVSRIPRTFNTADPGVQPLIDAIEGRYPGSVKQAEINIYGENSQTLTDFDIVTDTHVIQVKVGTGKGIVPQIKLSQSLTNRPVIGFDATKLIGKSGGFKPSVLKNAQQNNIFITNQIDELLNVLGEKQNAVHNPYFKP